MSASTAFRQAVLVEVLNPKTALFFLAFLPQFVRPEDGSVALQLALLGVIFIALGLASTIVYATSAARLGAFLKRHPMVLRRQSKAVGTIYCALGVRLALEHR
jgi:threonine/homoserine/homoserine lactone efflux protein